MGKREKAFEAPGAAPGPFNAALAGLAAGGGTFRWSRRRSPAPRGEAGREAAAARAVVRMERAGRGGRTVTVVEKLELRPAELEAWLGELKRALGCGGVVEGAALVLQGDTRERVGAWLAARGVKKVTVA